MSKLIAVFIGWQADSQRRGLHGVMRHKACKTAFVVIALVTSTCCAQGWTDYEASLGDGWQFVRCNSIETVIAKVGGEIVFSPTQYPNVGPIVEYFTTPSHIFLHNIGRTPRNLSPGDSLENKDPTQEFFFVVHKRTAAVTGPMTKQQFDTHPDVVSVGSVQWRIAENPIVKDLLLLIVNDRLLLSVACLSVPIIFSTAVLFIMYRWRGRFRTAT